MFWSVFFYFLFIHISHNTGRGEGGLPKCSYWLTWGGGCPEGVIFGSQWYMNSPKVDDFFGDNFLPKYLCICRSRCGHKDQTRLYAQWRTLAPSPPLHFLYLRETHKCSFWDETFHLQTDATAKGTWVKQFCYWQSQSREGGGSEIETQSKKFQFF